MKKAYAPVNVLIADDHELYREGFRVMLKKNTDFFLMGEAENGRELVKLAGILKPDIIITDIKMPVMDGIEATRILKASYPQIGVIAISMFDDENLIVDMMEAGARGYLLKNAHKNEIFDAIKTVHDEKTYYCHHTSAKLARMIASSKFNPFKKNEKAEFTDKEMEVIQMICKEYSNKEIAAEMCLSVRTVEGYREKIQEKMDVKNVAGVVIYAIKNDLFKI